MESTHRDASGRWARCGEVFRVFLKLGLISFGGPVAHIGYFRAELVEKRKWLDDTAYGDLVALCQFLPGPASSQAVFAIGLQRAGWVGGLLASIGFTLPSAALMILFGYGVTTFGNLQGAGWVHGLKLAAVAVVAQAVWGMGRSLCPDRARLTLAAGAAALLLVVPGALMQIGVILAGGLAGWMWYREEGNPTAMKSSTSGHHAVAASVLVLFFALLVLLPVAASAIDSTAVRVFDSFYRAGSLVFGGGHVVLPLLRAEVVQNGWVSDDLFLAGYGAVQAVPGPLFTFAGYLGTVMQPGPGAWWRGLWALLGIFLPAWLLIGGTLPFWNRLRARRWAQAGLRGANAAVVGVLAAALYNPVWIEAARKPSDVAAVVVAFALLQWWKLPPWLVVLLAAAAGQWVLA